MQQYVARGVHGQTVEVLAQRILNGQLAEGATLDMPALQSEFDVSLTVLRLVNASLSGASSSGVTSIKPAQPAPRPLPPKCTNRLSVTRRRTNRSEAPTEAAAASARGAVVLIAGTLEQPG